MKYRIFFFLALLLCLTAVACRADPPQVPTASTLSSPLPDSFRQELYDNKVEDILRQQLLAVGEEEEIYVIIFYDGPTQEQIDAVIEERWQIMKDIQSGSTPSQETTYTLPREGNGIDNRIALERDVPRELYLKAAYQITDEFFPDERQIKFISMYSPRIYARATRAQIRALSQSPRVLSILDGASREGTSTY